MCVPMCIRLCDLRIDEIFQKESDPFTTNEGMLEVINTIRFRHFDKAVEVKHETLHNFSIWVCTVNTFSFDGRATTVGIYTCIYKFFFFACICCYVAAGKCLKMFIFKLKIIKSLTMDIHVICFLPLHYRVSRYTTESVDRPRSLSRKAFGFFVVFRERAIMFAVSAVFSYC